ncbi:hypothetical protein [Williamsia muralis]|uniref:hypothetical protein n=1 Tax=Williamsia marianensis TaxID=85044 RepID=UPI000DE72E47|nr:hypothetical protein [Williamsia marianensis]PVY30882.1 hypothetical protein C7458_104416 [Williamsia marianensis]
MMATRAGQPLDRAERAELERLRRQVADGRRDQLDGQGGAGSGLPADRRGLRWSATILLLIIVAALAISGVLARFARSEVLDTDRYVETVSPLARNTALQNELSTQITAVIMERAKIAEVTREALSALTQNAPNVPPAGSPRC